MTLHTIDVERIPDYIVAQVRDDDVDYSKWLELRDAIAGRSYRTLIVYEDFLPLLVMGGLRRSLLSNYLELWLAPTVHLRWWHLPELKELLKSGLKDWLGPKLLAWVRVDNSKAQKFVKFFGLELEDRAQEADIYRVPSWL